MKINKPAIGKAPQGEAHAIVSHAAAPNPFAQPQLASDTPLLESKRVLRQPLSAYLYTCPALSANALVSHKIAQSIPVPRLSFSTVKDTKSFYALGEDSALCFANIAYIPASAPAKSQNDSGVESALTVVTGTLSGSSASAITSTSPQPKMWSGEKEDATARSMVPEDDACSSAADSNFEKAQNILQSLIGHPELLRDDSELLRHLASLIKAAVSVSHRSSDHGNSVAQRLGKHKIASLFKDLFDEDKVERAERARPQLPPPANMRYLAQRPSALKRFVPDNPQIAWEYALQLAQGSLTQILEKSNAQVSKTTPPAPCAPAFNAEALRRVERAIHLQRASVSAAGAGSGFGYMLPQKGFTVTCLDAKHPVTMVQPQAANPNPLDSSVQPQSDLKGLLHHVQEQQRSWRQRNYPNQGADPKSQDRILLAGPQALTQSLAPTAATMVEALEPTAASTAKGMMVLQQAVQNMSNFYYLFCKYEGVHKEPSRALLRLYQSFYTPDPNKKVYWPHQREQALVCYMNGMYGKAAVPGVYSWSVKQLYGRLVAFKQLNAISACAFKGDKSEYLEALSSEACTEIRALDYCKWRDDHQCLFKGFERIQRQMLLMGTFVSPYRSLRMNNAELAMCKLALEGSERKVSPMLWITLAMKLAHREFISPHLSWCQDVPVIEMVRPYSGLRFGIAEALHANLWKSPEHLSYIFSYLFGITQELRAFPDCLEMLLFLAPSGLRNSLKLLLPRDLISTQFEGMLTCEQEQCQAYQKRCLKLISRESLMVYDKLTTYEKGYALRLLLLWQRMGLIQGMLPSECVHLSVSDDMQALAMLKRTPYQDTLSFAEWHKENKEAKALKAQVIDRCKRATITEKKDLRFKLAVKCRVPLWKESPLDYMPPLPASWSNPLDCARWQSNALSHVAVKLYANFEQSLGHNLCTQYAHDKQGISSELAFQLFTADLHSQRMSTWWLSQALDNGPHVLKLINESFPRLFDHQSAANSVRSFTEAGAGEIAESLGFDPALGACYISEGNVGLGTKQCDAFNMMAAADHAKNAIATEQKAHGGTSAFGPYGVYASAQFSQYLGRYQEFSNNYWGQAKANFYFGLPVDELVRATAKERDLAASTASGHAAAKSDAAGSHAAGSHAVGSGYTAAPMHWDDISALYGYALRSQALEHNLSFAQNSVLHLSLLLRQEGNLPQLYMQEALLTAPHQFTPLLGMNFGSLQSLQMAVLSMCGLRPRLTAYYTNSTAAWIYRMLHKLYPLLPDNLLRRHTNNYLRHLSNEEIEERALIMRRKTQMQYKQRKRAQQRAEQAQQRAAWFAEHQPGSMEALQSAKQAREAEAAAAALAIKKKGDESDDGENEQELDVDNGSGIIETSSLHKLFANVEAFMLLSSMVEMYFSMLKVHGLLYEERCVFECSDLNSTLFMQQIELLHQCLLPRPNAQLVNCKLCISVNKLSVHFYFLRHDVAQKSLNMQSVVNSFRKRSRSNVGNAIQQPDLRYYSLTPTDKAVRKMEEVIRESCPANYAKAMQCLYKRMPILEQIMLKTKPSSPIFGKRRVADLAKVAAKPAKDAADEAEDSASSKRMKLNSSWPQEVMKPKVSIIRSIKEQDQSELLCFKERKDYITEQSSTSVFAVSFLEYYVRQHIIRTQNSHRDYVWGLSPECLRLGDVSDQPTKDNFSYHRRKLHPEREGYGGAIDLFLAAAVFQGFSTMTYGLCSKEDTTKTAEEQSKESQGAESAETYEASKLSWGASTAFKRMSLSELEGEALKAEKQGLGYRSEKQGEQATKSRSEAAKSYMPSFELFLYVLEALESQEAFFYECDCGHKTLVFNPYLRQKPIMEQSCWNCFSELIPDMIPRGVYLKEVNNPRLKRRGLESL